MEFEVNKLLTPYLYNDVLSVTKRTSFAEFEGKTVLVTGAGKPLGYYLCCALLINNDLSSAGTKIIAVDSSDTLMEKFGRLTYRGDIDFVVSRDYTYLGGERADCVIHTESVSALDVFTAPLNLLRFISANKAKALICVPADIYGDVFNGKEKITENDLFGYNDCAKAEKSSVQFDRMVYTSAKKLAKEAGLDIKLAVIAELYSAFEGKYIGLLKNAASRKSVEADRSVLPESAIYVADAAAAVVKVFSAAKSGEAVNIAADYTLSPSVLAELLSTLYGDKAKTVFTGREAVLSPMSPNLYVLDNTRLRRLGYLPDADPATGVTRALNILTEKGGEA